MSVKTISVLGTTGPIYRAVLHLTRRWTEDRGLPRVLVVSAPRGNRVTVTTDEGLAEYLVRDFTSLDGALEQGRRPEWPGGGELPGRCTAVVVG